jgi:hypothetical protein
MKTSLLLLTSFASAWALSNAVIVQEKSGSTQTNRVLTVPRYFAQGEICQYPQPYTSGNPVTYWQADVKTRWPADSNCAGGYAKFAEITIEITLAGSSNTVVEFRNSASSSSGGSGLSQSGMLSFNTGSGAGSWGAGFSATTGGVTMTCRVGSAIPCGARDMITAGMYKVLESGPLRTSVLVREGPDDQNGDVTRRTSVGWQCTANCTAPYSSAAWANNSTYYSIRPSYVITFYTSPTGGVANNHVETDYLLDNGWMDRAQDQLVGGIELDTGASEGTSCYSAPAVFVMPFRSRMFETCWQPSTPGSINIDFNRAYVTYSKVLPSYGLNWTIGPDAINLEIGTGPGTSCPAQSGTCSFLSSDQGATTNTSISPHMGWGQDPCLGCAADGGIPTLALFARWEAKYVVSGFNSGLVQVVLGNAKAWMHAPLFGLESNASAAYLTGNPALAFGRFISLDTRPTYATGAGSGTTTTDAPHSPAGNVVCENVQLGCPSPATACSAPACMVTCAYPSSATIHWCSVYNQTNTVNQWAQDWAHARQPFLVSYLFTGKYVYLEGAQALAAWDILASQVDTSPPSTPYVRWGTHGLIFDPFNTVRGQAWAMRNVGAAALVSPDGSVEQAYLLTIMNHNMEAYEGEYNITNGWFPPANPSCTGFNKATETVIWRMARCFYESGWSNPLNTSVQHGAGGVNLCEGCNGAYENDGVSPWMEQYWVATLAWLRDAGFKADYVHNAAAGRTMSMFADSTYYAGTSAGPAGAIEYRTPAMSPAASGTRNGYLQTWTAVKAAHIENTVLGLPLSSSATTMIVPDWGGTATGGGDNVYDAQIKYNTYYKVDNEIIYLNGGSLITTMQKNISAVNTSTSQVTATGHGLTDGQQIMVYGNPIDNGMVGNPLCGAFPGGLNNECRFYVHVIDANTLQFYNDAGLTRLVTLTGGSSGLTIYYGSWAISRGALGTTAGAHLQGATVLYLPMIVPPGRVGTPDAHGFFYTTAIATALDHDLTVTDAGTGKPITARRAWDIVNQIMYNQGIAGNNVSSCAGIGLTITNCDDPRWGILPRPLIRNVRIVYGSGTASLFYTAPDGNGCKVGVNATGFPSTDDSGDSVDGLTILPRVFVRTGLVSGTAYSYRITCGPSGGSARVSGVFTMQ